MSELLLINPRAKRRTMRRNPRRMSALQRQYFGGGRKRRVRRMRRNPIANLAPAAAPRRRGRVRSYLASRRARRSSGGGGLSFNGIVSDMLLPAAIGAGGALALDLAWGNLPIPDSLKTGNMAPIARIGGAVLIGVVAGMVGGKRFGAYAAVGAMTVTIADLAKTWAASSFPSVNLGAYVSRRGMGYYGAARQFSPRMGAYV